LVEVRIASHKAFRALLFDGVSPSTALSRATACSMIEGIRCQLFIDSLLEAVVHKCLQKDRQNRYQTVAELAIAPREFGSERAKWLVVDVCAVSKSTT
jgi:hypothetical protein